VAIRKFYDDNTDVSEKSDEWKKKVRPLTATK